MKPKTLARCMDFRVVISAGRLVIKLDGKLDGHIGVESALSSGPDAEFGRVGLDVKGSG